ncbi:MAG: hypothetical protein V1934_01255 [Methanobacteriota archaeon]
MKNEKILRLFQNRLYSLVICFFISLIILIMFIIVFGTDILFTSNEIDIISLLSITVVILIFIVGVNYFAGWLKRYKGWRTNYTRKITHFANFTFITLLIYLGGYTASFIFGLAIIVYGIIIVLLGDGNIFYEAVAREQDEPYRAFYIIVPAMATLLATLVTRSFFGLISTVGYLVVGWGDAVGEPVGVRFGSHRYKVRTITGIRCSRSIEGSCAVFVGSTVAGLFSLIFLIQLPISLCILGAICIGASATLVEAISPHGIDNFTIHIVASSITWLFA